MGPPLRVLQEQRLRLAPVDAVLHFELAEADKSQYQRVGQAHDGLGSLDFARVLAHIGKSVSVAAPLQGGAERTAIGKKLMQLWLPSPESAGRQAAGEMLSTS